MLLTENDQLVVPLSYVLLEPIYFLFMYAFKFIEFCGRNYKLNSFKITFHFLCCSFLVKGDRNKLPGKFYGCKNLFS